MKECKSHLHGVHSNVDVPTQQGIVNLLGEQPLAPNVCQGLVEHLVPSGLDHHNVQSTFLCKLWKGSLQASHDSMCEA